MVSATYEWLAFRRRDGARLAALVLAAGAVGLGLPADAVAQAKKAAEAPAAAEPPRIQRAYAAGVRAFESGDMAEADRQLSTALSGGGLPNAQMAKALYLRGTAYRQLGRPAQAISDLTTAVWLKGGLSETDKAKATQERQLAYREAGLGDSPPPIGAAPLDQSPTTATAASPAPTPGTQVVNVGKGGFWNNISMPSMPSLPSLSFGSSQTQTAAATPDAAAAAVPAQGFAPAAEGAPAEAAPAFGAVTVAAPEAAAGQQASVEQVAAGQSSSWDTQTSADAAVPSAQPVSTGYAPLQEAAGLAAVPGTAPAAPQAGGSASSGWSNPLAGSGTAISGFFGNIFGGGAGAQTASAEVAGVTTGSTNPAAGWGPETTVATAQTSSMVQRGPDAPVAAAPMAAPMAVAPMAAPMAAPATAAPMAAEAPTALPWTAAPGGPAQQAAVPQAATRMASTGPAAGRYKLQVASVRSREEAERLAETLRGYQPVRDGTVAPEVDEAVIGSMGTFYRVRLGPYANASEPGQLCKTLKPQGFDCLVVTQ